MDAKRLSEIEARANAATPGPWEIAAHAIWSNFSNQEPVCDIGTWTLQNENNAPFIAHARSDVPDLIARVRELEAQSSAVIEYYQRGRGGEVGELSEQIACRLGCSPEQVGMGIAADLAHGVEVMITNYLEKHHGARIRELEAENVELKAEVKRRWGVEASLQETILRLAKTAQSLEAQIAEMEEEARQRAMDEDLYT